MPAVHAYKDECQSAADVLRRAREVRANRMAMRPSPIAPKPARPQTFANLSDLVSGQFIDSIKVSGIVVGHYPVFLPDEITKIPMYAPLVRVSDDKAMLEVNINDIQRAVCAAFSVSKTELVSARRWDDLVRARHVAFMLCKILTSRSFPEIGRRFGGKDHTTIMHGIRKMEPVSVLVRERMREGMSLADVMDITLAAVNEVFGPYDRERRKKLIMIQCQRNERRWQRLRSADGKFVAGKIE